MEMPIQKKKWYEEEGIKKPVLQIKIIYHIGLKGPLSKRMAEKETGSDYSDVSNAIDNLLKRKMIAISLTNPGRASAYKIKGRKFYSLTAKGLVALINELPSSYESLQEFWSAIIWYCILGDKSISLDELEKYCTFI